jgi:hypothetical protein
MTSIGGTDGPRPPWLRTVAASAPVGPVEVSGALRVLVVPVWPQSAGPAARSQHDVESRLEQVLGGLEHEGLLEVTWHRWPGRDSLRERLRGSWHVLHYLGPDEEQQPSGPGRLMLTGDLGLPEPISAESFAGLLDEGSMLRLAVLQSRALDPTARPYASFAPRLAPHGPGGVVTLGGQPAEAVADFIGELYSALARGHGLVKAMQWAREAASIPSASSASAVYLGDPSPRLFLVHAGSRGPSGAAPAMVAREPPSSGSRYWPKRPVWFPWKKGAGVTEPGPGAEPSTAGAETPEEGAAGDVPAEEARRVRAEVWHRSAPRRSFVAGERNTVRCWIGLPDAGAASSDHVIPTVPLPPQGLELSVELRWAGEPDHGIVHLPADRTARSEDCNLHLDVPADATEVVAELMFRYRGRCFEAVELRAAALPAGQPESPADRILQLHTRLEHRSVIALPDAEPCSATLVFGGDRFGSYLGNGGRTYDLAVPPKVRNGLSSLLFATQQSLVCRAADAPDGRQVLDIEDEEVRVLIRELARIGAWLFRRLRDQGLADPGRRLQILTLDPESLVPLEFVYDRGSPDSTARLCAGWTHLADLPADSADCPACGPAPEELAQHTTVICPMGFWSLTRVIERLDPEFAEGGSVPLPERRDLPPVRSAVFACTSKVPAEDEAAAWRTIRSLVPGAVLAHDWDEWSRDVASRPALLVALAHHGEGDHEDYLEIGAPGVSVDLRQLRRSQLGPAYVNPDGHEPGPILLLLGCRTGVESDLGYLGMVSEFERYKASIVLGTYDRVLGRHAAPLAAELVHELVSVADPAADFGTILRRVRRRLLGRGLLLAFGLVALGDANYRLSVVDQGESRPA